MPLTLAGAGVPQIIKHIGGKDELQRFLASLGFIAGSQVTVISEYNGNVIVNVKESRVAISKSMACRIIV
ncbi:FeoA domain protein [Anaerotignum neopropionicum]|uniref:FeoA domain protein n=1 Tax=Anaerotignum neopropionicum TaxID=36847 RepID=A0A136WCQ0_9FIRM|nr:FeoA family protein [Anaerotignum neopropionicum]KXL52281.1 FeoA domain protein [Anaerotignum neopropionicum]